jgi:hypothetical protein
LLQGLIGIADARGVHPVADRLRRDHQLECMLENCNAVGVIAGDIARIEQIDREPVA